MAGDNSLPPNVRDRILRMYNEAVARLADADLLDQSGCAQSDSASILRVLAFEVLLKAALVRSGRSPWGHVYHELWRTLPLDVQEDVLRVANMRMPGVVNPIELDEILKDLHRVFVKARYSYELYEDYSIGEQHQIGEWWIEYGAPEHDADIRYRPEELECLVAGLKDVLERGSDGGTG